MVIMRYKKGKKVEVLNEREMPLGSWRPAKIISGNGHTYFVQYNQYAFDGNLVVEKVPRKAIRPCPPEVDGLMDWVAGDIVEAFNDNSWKIAQVSRELEEECYLVRLLGSSKAFRTHRSHLRTRQSWHDNQWIVVQKDSGECNSRILNSLSKGRNFKLCLEDDTFLQENQFVNVDHGYLKESTGPNYRSCLKKRSHGAFPLTEKDPGARRKLRALEKDGGHQRVVARYAVQYSEKVDAVASPRMLLGEKCAHSSFDNRTAGCSIMELGRGISKMSNKSYLKRTEPSDAESTSSSVGSCSVSNSPYRSPPQHHATCRSQDLPCYLDEAETSHSSEREFSLATREAFHTEIHQQELHAYRLTLMSLYASGPISWAQEASLTNLRLSLNISNDEHLLELRNLITSHMTKTPIS